MADLSVMAADAARVLAVSLIVVASILAGVACCLAIAWRKHPACRPPRRRRRVDLRV